MSTYAALCIDGTSATLKSTIIANLNMNNYKISNYYNIDNINSYGPAMLGYISSGLIALNNFDEFTIFDRSPLNGMEWALLWRLFDKFLSTYGNVSPDRETHKNFLLLFKNAFDKLKNLPTYMFWRKRLNVLVLIDTNIIKCDYRRYLRNKGSDRTRSSYKFYTFLQNEMYSILYESSCIDINNFDDEQKTIEYVTDFIQNTLYPKIMNEKKIINFKINVCRKNMPLQTNCDLFAINYSAYVQRKLIKKKPIDNKFLNIENISQSMSFHSLFPF